VLGRAISMRLRANGLPHRQLIASSGTPCAGCWDARLSKTRSTISGCHQLAGILAGRAWGATWPRLLNYRMVYGTCWSYSWADAGEKLLLTGCQSAPKPPCLYLNVAGTLLRCLQGGP
jgi:hypothetical protein